MLFRSFRLSVYRNKLEGAEHVALVQGDVTTDEPVLVRMHQGNILADSFGDVTPGAFFGGESRARGGELEASMRMIAAAGRGVVVMIRDPAPDVMSRAIKEREGEQTSRPIAELRQYGLGAQILADLGVKKMILLSNTKRNIVSLEGYGIEVVGQKPIDPPPGRGE